MLYSNQVLTFGESTNKYSTILKLNLVNEPDLTKILKVENFVHSDEQLRATYIILGYDLISSSFQAPKYVTKANDLSLHQINIIVSNFLVGLVSESTQLVELPSQHTAQEEATPSQPPLEETTKIVEVSDFEEDFEVFN